jgi:hypothetical protein
MPWKPSYITPTQLANQIADSASAADLDKWCVSASRAVDRATGRQFGSTDEPEPRTYRARWSKTKGMWQVETDDFMTVEDLEVDFDNVNDGTYATSIAVTGLMKYPSNAAQENKPWEGFYLRPAVSTGVDGRPEGFRVSITWGWSAVPDGIEGPTLLQGARFAARRDAPFGVAGSPDTGSETRLLAKADPDVVVMVKDFARRAWAR